MKVYVITSGCYSDYRIQAVALDKEQAEKIAATINNSRHYSDDFCEIEKYDTEDIKIDAKCEVKMRFHMTVNYRNTKEAFFECGYPVTEDVNEISVEKCEKCGGDSEIKITATLPKEITEEKAKKIMFDRIAEFKAQRAGI